MEQDPKYGARARVGMDGYSSVGIRYRRCHKIRQCNARRASRSIGRPTSICHRLDEFVLY